MKENARPKHYVMAPGELDKIIENAEKKFRSYPKLYQEQQARRIERFYKQRDFGR